MPARQLASMCAGLVAAAVLGIGCGGDDAGGATSDAATETTGAYEIVSDTAVAEGLAATTAEMEALAAAPEDATDEAVLAVFDGWATYEGTIKQNEPESYLALEDAMGVFKKGAEGGDPVGMQTGITDFSTAAAEYLAVHPAA